MKKSNTILAAIAASCVLLLAFVVVKDYRDNNELARKNQELQSELQRLAKEEERSAVMQRVNAQMEEIANEERRISDEQREAAERQTEVAEEMRRKAEEERQNALSAEQRALESSNVAQHQRQIAEHQRAEAELSKRVADTLTYISLARTLGQTAITQFNAGNHELADLLAHTACLFTNRYHGDIYARTVYQPLAMTSQNKRIWNKHKGSVTDIAFSDDKYGYMVTCSTYGEVMKHTNYNSSQMVSETLVSNPRYDFRDIYIDRTTNVI